MKLTLKFMVQNEDQVFCNYQNTTCWIEAKDKKTGHSATIFLGVKQANRIIRMLQNWLTNQVTNEENE